MTEYNADDESIEYPPDVDREIKKAIFTLDKYLDIPEKLPTNNKSSEYLLVGIGMMGLAKQNPSLKNEGTQWTIACNGLHCGRTPLAAVVAAVEACIPKKPEHWYRVHCTCPENPTHYDIQDCEEFMDIMSSLNEVEREKIRKQKGKDFPPKIDPV